MKLRLSEQSEIIVVESKSGDFTVQLTEAELGEYRIVEEMFFKWQHKLKLRCKNKDGTDAFSRTKPVWRE